MRNENLYQDSKSKTIYLYLYDQPLADKEVGGWF